MKPSDEQKIVVHLAREATKTDDPWTSRADLLNGKLCPAPVGMKLVWAALTMPDGILDWSGDGQKFRLSDAALQAVNAGVPA